MCSGYYNPEGDGQSHNDGWLRTGDVGTINEFGYIRLVDRSKDVIKSGGEWVSSADVENIIMSHPKVCKWEGSAWERKNGGARWYRTVSE